MHLFHHCPDSALSSTGLAAHASEECWAMAEMTTLSLEVDLVLSDTAATSEP